MRLKIAIYLVLPVAVVAQSSAAHPDLSGYWELRYDSENVPPALLTPQAAAADVAAQVRKDQEAIRWFKNLGVTFILGDRSPLDLRQSPTVAAIVARPQSSTRYIYTDGRGHPAKDDYNPTTNGHSIGHWEGDTLLVDTVGFNDRGATRIPGGGVRTPDAHLVERYRLVEGGQRLSVTFTWDDPKIFQKAHTYEFRYYKIPRITGARMFGCNANDAERAKFLTETPQNQ